MRRWSSVSRRTACTDPACRNGTTGLLASSASCATLSSEGPDRLRAGPNPSWSKIVGRNEFSMFRIAAIGDLHLRGNVSTSLVREIRTIHHRADVLVVTGDITNGGRIVEVELAAELFRLAQLPIIAVLGNHDRRSLRMHAFKETLALAGVTVLDGAAIVLDGGLRIGFAGVGGSGGGFWPDEGPDTLSRRACQALAVRARREAARLDAALSDLKADL